MPSTAPPQPPAPVWHEFGRPSSGEAQDWATWVSPRVGDDGDAPYRSLVLADGAIAVTVELHARGASGPRTIHRGRCGLPPDPDQTAERVRLLLGAADKAMVRAMAADRGEAGAAPAGRATPPRRVPDNASRDAGGRDRGVSAAPREREERTREHARQEARTAA